MEEFRPTFLYNVLWVLWAFVYAQLLTSHQRVSVRLMFGHFITDFLGSLKWSSCWMTQIRSTFSCVTYSLTCDSRILRCTYELLYESMTARCYLAAKQDQIIKSLVVCSVKLSKPKLCHHVLFRDFLLPVKLWFSLNVVAGWCWANLSTYTVWKPNQIFINSLNKIWNYP